MSKFWNSFKKGEPKKEGQYLLRLDDGSYFIGTLSMNHLFNELSWYDGPNCNRYTHWAKIPKISEKIKDTKVLMIKHEQEDVIPNGLIINEH